MGLPQKFHSVVDDGVCAGPTHEVCDREGVDNSRRGEEVPGRESTCAVAWSGWPPFVVEVVKSPQRIDDAALEKGEEAIRLLAEGKKLGLK